LHRKRAFSACGSKEEDVSLRWFWQLRCQNQRKLFFVAAAGGKAIAA
jgi:hypothetical protein